MPVLSTPGPRESRRSRPYAWPAPGPFRSTGSRANPMVFFFFIQGVPSTARAGGRASGAPRAPVDLFYKTRRGGRRPDFP